MFYTYLIGWRLLDVWYYGYRTSNTPNDDLWVKYFTSSKYVTEFRKVNGEPDVILVHKTFDRKEEALRYEDRWLRRVNAVKSDRWLNRARRGVEFRSPKVFTEKSRKKMSDSQKRYLSENKKVVTDVMRETSRRNIKAFNDSGKKKVYSRETRGVIAAKLKGNVNGRGARSDETKAKLSAATKTRPILTCLKCKMECVVNAFHQHRIKCEKS